MAFVELTITEPENNLPLEGVQSLDFTGAVVTMPEEAQSLTLYYRWYSSLYEPELNEDMEPYYFSIEQNAQTQADDVFTWMPGIGTHAITFAVSDQAGETLDDFKAIEHSGVTGGAEEGEGQCLVHVFVAVPLAPQGDITSLPRTELRLIAEAPAAWGSPIPETAPVVYEVNEDYHAYNRLRYRWELIPDDPTADAFEYPRDLPEGMSFPEDMDFNRYSYFNADIEPTTVDTPNPLDVFVVHFQPPLEHLNLLSGGYTIVLHVEDIQQPGGIGHVEDSFHVTIQA